MHDTCLDAAEHPPLYGPHPGHALPGAAPMPELAIRPARHGDHDALERLYARAYAALLRPDYERRLLNEVLPLISRPSPALLRSGSYFVAEAPDGRLLAAGGWSWLAPQGGVSPADMAHIRHVVTHQDYARRGIGARLMTHAMCAALEAGARRLNCMSTLTAEPFYRALGFHSVARVSLQIAPGLGFPAVHMRRVL